jgi:Zn finger protein HypA/HybF involved in hydrogenase expression
MLIAQKKVITTYKRLSKLGKVHEHTRTKIVLELRCDNCSRLFERDQSKINPKRRSNTYFHVCPDCDAKRFAQRKGVERRFIWDKPASSSDDISKL